MTDQPHKGIMGTKHGNELTYMESAWHTVSTYQCLLMFISRRGKEALDRFKNKSSIAILRRDRPNW